MGKKVFSSVLTALLTYAAVWGTYVAVLSAGMNNHGDPPYVLSVLIALTVEFVIYKATRLFMQGLRRFISCTAAPLLPMLITALALRGGGEKSEMLGSAYNVYILLGMVGFCFLAALRLIIAKLMPERVRRDPFEGLDDIPDEPEENKKETKAEKSAQK